MPEQNKLTSPRTTIAIMNLPSLYDQIKNVGRTISQIFIVWSLDPSRAISILLQRGVSVIRVFFYKKSVSRQRKYLLGRMSFELERRKNVGLLAKTSSSCGCLTISELARRTKHD